MSKFLTDGRLALVAALQGDAELDARVSTWFDYGPGLRRRRALEPALCPALSIAPAGADHRPAAATQHEVRQLLRVEAATCGTDVADCEEIVALVAARVQACDADCLGLADDGLAGVAVESVGWRVEPDADAARPIWTATVDLALLWRRS